MPKIGQNAEASHNDNVRSWDRVGQIGNLRPIGNRPLCAAHRHKSARFPISPLFTPVLGGALPYGRGSVWEIRGERSYSVLGNNVAVNSAKGDTADVPFRFLCAFTIRDLGGP
jgi:hypothetical protein